jgi:hypothetical protein
VRVVAARARRAVGDEPSRVHCKKIFRACTLYAEPRTAPAAAIAGAETSRFSVPFRHITKL